MKKADLADMVQGYLEGTKTQAEKVVDMVFEAIADAMAKGQEVDIARFGKFMAQKRAARTARNPRTGEPVKVPAMMTPKFKASKSLKDMMN